MIGVQPFSLSKILFRQIKHKRNTKYKPRTKMHKLDYVDNPNSFDDSYCNKTARSGSVENVCERFNDCPMVSIVRTNTSYNISGVVALQNINLTNRNDFQSQQSGCGLRFKRVIHSRRRSSARSVGGNMSGMCLSEQLWKKAKQYPQSILSPCKISQIIPRQKPKQSLKISSRQPKTTESFRERRQQNRKRIKQISIIRKSANLLDSFRSPFRVSTRPKTSFRMDYPHQTDSQILPKGQLDLTENSRHLDTEIRRRKITQRIQPWKIEDYQQHIIL